MTHRRAKVQHPAPHTLRLESAREAEQGSGFGFYKNGDYVFTILDIFSVTPVPRQGRYDLEIRNSSYERDQAEFKCMMKQAGTGGLLHTSKVIM